MTKAKRRLVWLLLPLVVSLLAASGQEAGDVSAEPGGFTPFPACGARNWRLADPSFEPLPGAKAFYGSYDGGLYRFEIPDKWNGELLLYMHGAIYTFLPDGDLLGRFFPGPGGGLRRAAIENGFAWGTSSFRCNGLVSGVGVLDTLSLKQLFPQISGREPSRTYLAGHSMGGGMTILTAQEFPTAFDGFLPMCPLTTQTFDWMLETAAAAEYLSGIRYTNTSIVPDTMTLILNPRTQAQMVAVLGQPGSYTLRGLALASVMINQSGGPRPFALQGLALPPPNGFLARLAGPGAAALGGGDPHPLNLILTNSATKYSVDPSFGVTSAELDAGVRRRAADAAFRGPGGPYAEFRPPNGQIERPMLAIHTTGDLFVPINSLQALQRAVDASKRSDLLVTRTMRAPGHCTFSEAEQSQAFLDLALWVRTGQKPGGENVLGDLSNTGLKFTNPLRPGDPGTLHPLPGMATSRTPAPGETAIRPPATGDAGLQR